MYIAPNSTIKILHDVPIDATYEHTLYFPNKNQQYNYFSSKVKGPEFIFTEQTYVRQGRGYVRVQMVADRLYDCNYIMFQNTNFGDRWFYGFITNIEYINNNVAEIRYSLDVMQTWMFDYNLQQVFVEREHSVTDNVGDNLVVENLEHGEYIIQNRIENEDMPVLTEYCYMILTSFESGRYDMPVQARAEVIGNVMQGMEFTFFDTEDEVQNFINGHSAKIDGIFGIYQVPKLYRTHYSRTAEHREQLHTDVIPLNAPPTQIGNANVGFYTPKNKKLLTQPYSFLYVENGQGNTATFGYEYFATVNNNKIPRFLIQYGISGSPSYCLTPYGYKTGDASIYNRNERMFVTDLPQLTWNNDSFKAWLCQNAGSLAVKGLSIATAIGTGNPMFLAGATAQTSSSSQVTKTDRDYSGVLQNRKQVDSYNESVRYGSPIGEVAQVLGTMVDHYLVPPQMHGNSDSTLNLATDSFGFRFYNMQIHPQYARIIDEYFNMYGYATHRVKVPNTHSRPHWNYVKTINCKITGSIPSDDENLICSIYNGGITFWKNPNEVGNYNLDNRPN